MCEYWFRFHTGQHRISFSAVQTEKEAYTVISHEDCLAGTYFASPVQESLMLKKEQMDTVIFSARSSMISAIHCLNPCADLWEGAGDPATSQNFYKFLPVSRCHNWYQNLTYSKAN